MRGDCHGPSDHAPCIGSDRPRYTGPDGLRLQHCAGFAPPRYTCRVVFTGVAGAALLDLTHSRSRFDKVLQLGVLEPKPRRYCPFTVSSDPACSPLSRSCIASKSVPYVRAAYRQCRGSSANCSASAAPQSVHECCAFLFDSCRHVPLAERRCVSHWRRSPRRVYEPPNAKPTITRKSA